MGRVTSSPVSLDGEEEKTLNRTTLIMVRPMQYTIQILLLTLTGNGRGR
jgi:hypothetical protein